MKINQQKNTTFKEENSIKKEKKIFDEHISFKFISKSVFLYKVSFDVFFRLILNFKTTFLSFYFRKFYFLLREA